MTEVNALAKKNDCLSCRIIGTGALGGTGAYAIWQSRAAAPGSMVQKRILAGLGLGNLESYSSIMLELINFCSTIGWQRLTMETIIFLRCVIYRLSVVITSD